MLDPKQCKEGDLVICYTLMGESSIDFTHKKVYIIHSIERGGLNGVNIIGDHGSLEFIGARLKWFKKLSGKLAKHLYEN